jgi:hypothetical protein
MEVFKMLSMSIDNQNNLAVAKNISSPAKEGHQSETNKRKCRAYMQRHQ